MRNAIALVAFLLFNANVFAAAPPADNIFADGFEGFPWFQDADGDSFGNPLVVVHEYTQPAGYVADNTDCDDTNAAVHPGAPDDPDGQFVDSNCDGSDGDATKAIFVATTGADVVECGTQATPCLTIGYAIQFVTPQHPQMYIQQGTYSASTSITRDARLYGGFDAQWHRGPVVSAGANTVLQGAETPFPVIGTQAITLYVSNATVTLDDIVVVGPDANAQRSSYAIYATTGTIVTLDRDEVFQGSGAIGVTGAPGVAASVLTVQASQNGGNGGSGAQASTFCDTTSRGSSGPIGTNACIGSPSTRLMSGGIGGLGGTMDGNCTDFIATPGIQGSNAAFVSAPSGLGGPGGAGASTCGAGVAGTAGFVLDGSAGAVGMGNSVSGGLWQSAAGGTGQTGENGGGGGGGGGSGGCDVGTDAYGGGGGGGAAGGCAAHSGGTGGTGGGSSFGLFAVSSNAVVNQTVFYRGVGGAGGTGGPGGAGQPGGTGGTGGAHPNSGLPGKGGNGGRGGASGAGGGGQGGAVYGIYSVQSGLTENGNQYLDGTAGLGGAGGAAPPSGGAVGGTGADGALGNVGSCSTLSSCN